MKHLSITIATLAIVAFVSCEKIGGDNDKNNPYKPLELTTKSAEFVQKGNDFSVEFIHVTTESMLWRRVITSFPL